MSVRISSDRRDIELTAEQFAELLATLLYQMERPPVPGQKRVESKDLLIKRLRVHFVDEDADGNLTLQRWERVHLLQFLENAVRRKNLELPRLLVDRLLVVFSDDSEVSIHQTMPNLELHGSKILLNGKEFASSLGE